VAKCKLLVLKLGERGVIACRSREHEELDSFFAIDSFASNCIDPVGAGDAMLAYATLAMLVGERDAASDVAAVIIGSIAAAIECEHEGNVAVSADDVRARIDAVEWSAR
jgi:sugar/nucleoside kinase (ribokinase family)